MKAGKAFLVLLSISFSVQSFGQKTVSLLAGTYTGPGKGEGIYVYDFNLETGNATLRSSVKNVANPSYLTLSPDKKFVYSVNENGAASGASAFSLDAAAGKIAFLNKVDMAGKDPCYIIADEKNVLTANYSSGDITVYNRLKDGRLGEIKQVARHSGRGLDKKRQGSAHTHMVYWSPDKKYLLSNDLGTDRIYIYKYAKNSAAPLSISDSVYVGAGAGPRHLAFSKNGATVYLIGEMDGFIYAYNYKDGQLTFKEKQSAIQPASAVKEFDGADLHVSPDGKFLYASLRAAQNSITIFSLGTDGSMQYVDRVETKGTGPRNFAITPDGKWLLAAHQKTNNVVVFKRDQATGKLKASGQEIEIGAPVCLVFF